MSSSSSSQRSTVAPVRYWGGHLLPAALLVWLFAKDWLERSLYNDGLWYAMLSRNLARGEGELWAPKLTDTIFTTFHEHPPLGFIVQAPFFALLGEGWHTERIYTAVIFAVTVGLLWRLWQRAGGSAQHFWIPLSFWLFNEINTHFYPSNILEPLLSVWALAAVNAAWRSADTQGRNRYAWAAAAGVFTLLAVLTKGPVGAFPLAFFALHTFAYRSITLREAAWLTAVMTITLALGLLALLLCWPDAREGLVAYWNTQVEASLAKTRRDRHHRNNRLYLMGRLAGVMAPALGVCALAWYRSALRPKLPRASVLLLLLGLSASLPMVVSPKQSYYYLLPSLPYFAFGLGLWVAALKPQGFAWAAAPWAPKAFNALMVLFTLAGIVRAGGFYGDINRRDAETLPDMQAVAIATYPDTIIASATYDPYVVGYLGRLYDMSIDTFPQNRPKYSYLLTDECQLDSVRFDSAVWQPLELDTDFYLLYKRKTAR